MKNIKLYELEETYRNEESSLEYPTVSYTKDTEKVWYLMKPELYEWVDLGLPSGLKWAAWNVGATKPEEFGLYFAWGETQGYTGITDEKGFYWGDYQFTTAATGSTDATFRGGLTKYNRYSRSGVVDNLTILEVVDDAAYVTDDSCRMPTKEEMIELSANTTSAWTQVNGVNGCRFTSKVNGNSIFIPAAGFCLEGSTYYVGEEGVLWSSSLDSSDTQSAFYLDFSSDILDVVFFHRYDGLPVRAVKE